MTTIATDSNAADVVAPITTTDPMSRQQNHLAKQDLTTLDTAKLTALTPEVVSVPLFF
jgi:hypothetical protein